MGFAAECSPPFRIHLDHSALLWRGLEERRKIGAIAERCHQDDGRQFNRCLSVGKKLDDGMPWKTTCLAYPAMALLPSSSLRAQRGFRQYVQPGGSGSMRSAGNHKTERYYGENALAASISADKDDATSCRLTVNGESRRHRKPHFNDSAPPFRSGRIQTKR